MSESDTGSKTLFPNECWGSSQEQIISIHKLQMHFKQLGLSRYKLPRFILAIKNQFPTTSTGKVKEEDQSTPPDSRGIPLVHNCL
ncbi:hypothetical protein BDL97_14G045000 [Sphagnum fallax]|nr:hypothetical protein BDL97_14G045000 [Sphagnum fallax]